MSGYFSSQIRSDANERSRSRKNFAIAPAQYRHASRATFRGSTSSLKIRRRIEIKLETDAIASVGFICLHETRVGIDGQ
jgi:hypothetical protein